MLFQGAAILHLCSKNFKTVCGRDEADVTVSLLQYQQTAYTSHQAGPSGPA